MEHAAAESKGIKVHFRMDENGLLNLDSVSNRKGLAMIFFPPPSVQVFQTCFLTRPSPPFR